MVSLPAFALNRTVLLADQLTAYELLRQQHAQQIDPALQALHAHIAQQVAELQAEEQIYLDARQSALYALRPTIEADARCLLSTRSLIAFVFARASQRSQYPLGERLSVNPNPRLWQLAIQPLPLQIVGYEAQRDDNTYNNENGEAMPQIDLVYPRMPIDESWSVKELVDRFPRAARKYGIRTSNPEAG